MIRRAQIKDIAKIHELINFYAKKDLMLPCSLNQLYENLRNFWVASQGNNLIGCCALKVIWEDLAEIRSLAVLEPKQKKGMGSKLIKACLAEAKRIGIKKVFTLTYLPDYFKKFGFLPIDKSKLPHKIWGDCLVCPKFPDCDEIALMKVIK